MYICIRMCILLICTNMYKHILLHAHTHAYIYACTYITYTPLCSLINEHVHEYLPGIPHHNVDRLVQDFSNSNASALELLQSRTKPSICGLNRRNPVMRASRACQPAEDTPHPNTSRPDHYRLRWSCRLNRFIILWCHSRRLNLALTWIRGMKSAMIILIECVKTTSI